MGKRKISFENNEFYHVYNRGVDKRNIIGEKDDINRILESFDVFNTKESIGSLYEHSFEKNQLGIPVSKLVKIIAFNILDNHYHLVLEQIATNGISKFIKSFAGGYTKHFNEKYDRSGVLFQGPFKAEHINSDKYLRYVVDYVNLNHYIHGLEKIKLSEFNWGERSSLEQYYLDDKKNWKNKNFECDTKVVLSGYKSRKEYKKESLKMAEFLKEGKKEFKLTTWKPGFQVVDDNML